MKPQELYNPLVIWLLRSPLHGVMNKITMLITYMGRRSGKTYTVPVNYLWDGEDLLSVGSRDHSWWKNFRGGAPAKVRVRGRDLGGFAETFEGPVAENGLLILLREMPAYRRYWKVAFDTEGHPRNPETLARIWDENALVRVRGLSEVRRP